jgi:isopentenyl diphosphate isomerase/L-lactate dehydrogenase-like FMN-dependent dehydrogenase
VEAVAEDRWRQSVGRREALLALSAFLAGSPLLQARQDPSAGGPLTDHRRALSIDETVTAFDFEAVFFANVPLATFDTTAHASESEFTLRRNREAFGWVDVIPQKPVATSSVNTSTELFGLKMDYPIFVAPTGHQGLFHPDGEVGMRRGSTAARTLFCIPSGTNVPIEKIAAAGTGPIWWQLYARQQVDENRELLEQAQTVGCRAIIITIDQQAGYYERDLHDFYLALKDEPAAPRAGSRAPRNPYRVSLARAWYDWKLFDQLRPWIKVPMLAKGVLTPEDAERCLEHGVDGILVSNHGGRALDYSPSTLEVLPEILDAVRGRVPVLIDSGFRRGADVLKALALGAKAVGLGRVPRWGLGAYGAAGVQRVLEIMQQELVLAMAQAGRPTLASLDRSAVRTRFS